MAATDGDDIASISSEDSSPESPLLSKDLEQVSDSDGREAISSDEDEEKKPVTVQVKNDDLENVSDDDDDDELDLTSNDNQRKETNRLGLDDLGDHGELDYDDDDAPQPAPPVQVVATALVEAEPEEVGEEKDHEQGRVDVSSDEDGLDELKLDEVAEPEKTPRKEQVVHEGSEDGEVVESGDGSEDGEIAETGGGADGDSMPRRSYGGISLNIPCRFFFRGTCTFGDACKFSHGGAPKVPLLDLSHGINLRDLRRRYEGPPVDEAPPDVQEEEERLPPTPPTPKVETAWERGLRQAKELMKRSKLRKENEPDLKEKRMNLTLVSLSPEPQEKHPYYDQQSDDELVRYDDDGGAVAEARQSWHGGHYENFEIRYTREANNYSPTPPELFSRQRSDRSPDMRRRLSQMPNMRRGPVRQASPAPITKGRGDEWRDPWMRATSPKDRRRRSLSSGGGHGRARRRRDSSSGSSSDSRSRSSSHSSSSSSSGSSSSSSSSSRSSYGRGGRKLPYPKRRREPAHRSSENRHDSREDHRGGRPLDIPRRPPNGPFSVKQRPSPPRRGVQERHPPFKVPPVSKASEKRAQPARTDPKARTGHRIESPVKKPPTKHIEKKVERRHESPPPPPPGKKEAPRPTKPGVKQIGPSKAEYKDAKVEKVRAEAEKALAAKRAIKPAPKPVARKPVPKPGDRGREAARAGAARKRGRSSDSDSSLSSVTSSSSSGSSSDNENPDNRREKLPQPPPPPPPKKPVSPRLRPPPPKAARPSERPAVKPDPRKDDQTRLIKPVQHVKPLPKTPESPRRGEEPSLKTRRDEPVKKREEPKKVETRVDDLKRGGIKLTLIKKTGDKGLKRPAEALHAAPVKKMVKEPKKEKSTAKTPPAKKEGEKKPEKRKSAGNRREELLKQLKAVEDAIARKRSKLS